MTVATNEHKAGPNLPDQINYARALAESNLLPKQYAKQPANVLLAMQLGDALGIPPIQAINGIHVVEGKPTASADLIASLIRRAGHKLRVREEGTGDALKVTATLIRADDPEFPFEAVWDIAKARQAGLLGKGVWKQYPGQMMRSRAITEVARMGASDALYGVIYTPEELGGEAATPAATTTVTQAAPAVSPAMSFEDAMAADERDWIAEAQELNTAGEVADLWREAKAAGVDDKTLAAVTAVGRALRDQEAREQLSADLGAEQVDDQTGEVLDAEVVES